MFAGLFDDESAAHLELGEDAVARFDGEAVHEGLGDGFADAAGAVKRDVAELVSQGRDFGQGGQWGLYFYGGAAEFGVAETEGPCLVAEVADAVGEDVGGEGAGFEGVHVTVDGGVGLGDLGFGGSQLFSLLAGGVGRGLLVGFEGAGDQFGVAVEIDQRCEDSILEGVGAEAFTGAGLLAVAPGGPAGVVAVAVSFAVSGHADVVAVAAGAGDEPGE